MIINFVSRWIQLITIIILLVKNPMNAGYSALFEKNWDKF